MTKLIEYTGEIQFNTELIQDIILDENANLREIILKDGRRWTPKILIDNGNAILTPESELILHKIQAMIVDNMRKRLK